MKNSFNNNTAKVITKGAFLKNLILGILVLGMPVLIYQVFFAAQSDSNENKIKLTADKLKITPGETVTFNVLQKQSTYEYTWYVNEVKKSSFSGKSEQKFKFDKEGNFKVKVEVIDRSANKFIGSDSLYIKSGNIKQETPDPKLEKLGDISFIAVNFKTNVEYLDISRNSKTTFNLTLERIAFNNLGKYDINGEPYQSNIFVDGNFVKAKFIQSNYQTKELILNYDDINKKKLSGVTYTEKSSYNSGKSKTNSIITLDNIPFKIRKGKTNEGRIFYEYTYKGDISSYIQKFAHESSNRTSNGTFINKWGKYDKEWEIYINVTY